MFDYRLKKQLSCILLLSLLFSSVRGKYNEELADAHFKLCPTSQNSTCPECCKAKCTQYVSKPTIIPISTTIIPIYLVL